jgi:hypothetical protein
MSLTEDIIAWLICANAIRFQHKTPARAKVMRHDLKASGYRRILSLKYTVDMLPQLQIWGMWVSSIYVKSQTEKASIFPKFPKVEVIIGIYLSLVCPAHRMSPASENFTASRSTHISMLFIMR